MADSARKKQRPSPVAQDQGTPINNAMLQPMTPFRRAISAGPTPGRTPVVRTPGTGRTPRGGPATRPLTSRRIAPTTPHAIRALRERANAARTPGNNRRRSGRIQRETPRDLLRDLSRALARTSRPVEPSPQVLPRRPRHSALDLPDVEDGPPVAAPRLSMPLENMYDDDDDDSFHSAPPRQSLLPDLPDDVDGGTVQSLEFGRRAISEDPRSMYGRRQSERFADLSELGAVEEEFEIDGTFINRRTDGLLDDALEDAMEGDDTTIQVLTGGRNGRTSDVNLGVFGDGDDDTEEPTFRFMIPDRIRAPPRFDPPGEQPIQEDDIPDSEPVEFPDDTELPDEDDHEPTALLEGDDPTQDGGDLAWESDPPVDDDAELAAYREEESAIDRSLQTQSPERPAAEQAKGGKKYMVSEHGIDFPSFPAAPVKKLALSFMKSQGGKGHLSKETLDALVHTTNDFFEQISIDLAAYAQHGGRKMIEESDVIALMKRTRKTNDNTTSFSLAQKMLPRELLQQLRMEPPIKLRGEKRKRLRPIQEDDDEDEDNA
ncbi:hypothetical protein yc1106_10072 [Curvularia clavata]|uniref:CENP-T/Histone H4 histone fold domain-containing protein n=1 Tax=Curvularia clavata TaxID=95742 RepID=A0A9Q8ZLC8_CURCL|nr:hypothetical protein yc1106_10072 [Curvularia clavata]